MRAIAVTSSLLVSCVCGSLRAQPLDSVRPDRAKFYRAVVDAETGVLTFLEAQWTAARDAGNEREAGRWRDALHSFVWNGGEHEDVLRHLPREQQKRYLVRVQEAMASLRGAFNDGIARYRDNGDPATAKYLENEWGAFERNAQKPGLLDAVKRGYRLEFYTADAGGLMESATDLDFPNVLHFGRHLNRIKIQGAYAEEVNVDANHPYEHLGKLFQAPLVEQRGYLAAGVAAESGANAYLICIARGSEVLVQTTLPLNVDKLYLWRIAKVEGGVEISISDESGESLHRGTIPRVDGLSIGFGATVRKPDVRARLAVLFANPPLDQP